MSVADLSARFAVAFGEACPLPEGGSRSAGVELRLNAEAFRKLVRHWEGLGHERLPRLRGLTLFPGATSGARLLQLVVDAGERSPLVLISADWPGPPSLASLRRLWPFSAWWETEVARFYGLDTAAPDEGRVVWRRS